MIMNYSKPRGPVEIDEMVELEMVDKVRVLSRETVRAAVPDDGASSVESLSGLLGQVSETSKREIDNLIDELQMLRGKLQSDTDRIQGDIAKYATMSEQVMQLTKIISESCKSFPAH
jgi:hypothetical protein